MASVNAPDPATVSGELEACAIAGLRVDARDGRARVYNPKKPLIWIALQGAPCGKPAIGNLEGQAQSPNQGMPAPYV